jgi:hypothetical protein
MDCAAPSSPPLDDSKEPQFMPSLALAKLEPPPGTGTAADPAHKCSGDKNLKTSPEPSTPGNGQKTKATLPGAIETNASEDKADKDDGQPLTMEAGVVKETMATPPTAQEPNAEANKANGNGCQHPTVDGGGAMVSSYFCF